MDDTSLVTYKDHSGIGHNLTTGRLYSPVAVRTVTTRQIPSDPGCVSMMRPKGHFIGLVCSFTTSTSVPTWTLGCLSCHFILCWRVCIYSFDHLLQKSWCIFCSNFQRWRGPTRTSDRSSSGTIDKGSVVRK
ncbi:uncharacterized protein LOC125242537 [Leguminivora glycinivorella]|uniref:uncharacterized protein LOC125242537 n=1 Tax=Leguminivora glycinivorella TaxID=1035111 RepID=UPI00200D587B|nr:uncharacterized protein LOC125242537 [Leguminivora glycinivorella]